MAYFEDKPPLGASARVRRGFARAGVVLAVPILAAAVLGALWAPWSDYYWRTKNYKEATCLRPFVEQVERSVAVSGPKALETKVGPGYCGHYFVGDSVVRVRNYLSTMKPDAGEALKNSLIWLGVGSLLALIVYAATSAIGWAFSGFFRD